MGATASVSVLINAALGSSFKSSFEAATQSMKQSSIAVASLSGQRAGLEALGRDATHAAESMTALGNSATVAAGKWTAARSKLNGLKLKMNDLSNSGADQKKVDALQKQIDKAQQLERVLYSTFQERRKDAEAAENYARLTASRAAEAEKHSTALEASAARVMRAQSLVETRRSALDQAQGRLDANRSRRGELRGQFMGTALAAGGIGALLHEAFAFEKSGLRLTTAMGGDYMAELAKSRAAALAYGSKHLGTPEEHLSAQYAFNSAGFAPEISRQLATTAIRAAMVTGGHPEGTAENMATVLNNFRGTIKGKDDAEKGANVGDVFTTIQHRFALRNLDQLMEGLKYVYSGAMMRNTRFDEVSTLTGFLNNTGLTGSMAGTAMNRFMENLPKASQQLGFKQVKHEDGTYDLVGTLDNLRQAILKKFPGSDQATSDKREAVLRKIFGERGIRAEVLLSSRFNELKSGYELVRNNSEGQVEHRAKDFDASGFGQMGIAGQQTKILAIQLGTALFPVLNQILPPVTAFVTKLSEWTVAHPELVGEIGVLVTGLIGLKLATLGTGYAWSLLKTPLLAGEVLIGKLGVRAAETALKMETLAATQTAAAVEVSTLGSVTPATATALRGLSGAAVGASSVLWVTAGVIGAVAVTALLARKYWDDLSVAFDGFGESFSAAVDPIKPALTEAFSEGGKVLDWFTTKVDGTTESMTRAQKIGQTLGTTIGTAVTEAVRPVLMLYNAVRLLDDGLRWLEGKAHGDKTDAIEKRLQARGSRLLQLGSPEGTTWDLSKSALPWQELKTAELQKAMPKLVPSVNWNSSRLYRGSSPESRKKFENLFGEIGGIERSEDGPKRRNPVDEFYAAGRRLVKPGEAEGGAAGSTITHTGPISITINPAPGMDEKAIARAAREEFDRLYDAKARRAQADRRAHTLDHF